MAALCQHSMFCKSLTEMFHSIQLRNHTDLKESEKSFLFILFYYHFKLSECPGTPWRRVLWPSTIVSQLCGLKFNVAMNKHSHCVQPVDSHSQYCPAQLLSVRIYSYLHRMGYWNLECKPRIAINLSMLFFVSARLSKIAGTPEKVQSDKHAAFRFLDHLLWIQNCR